MAITTVTDYLEATAARLPNKTAFVWDGGSMTFDELRTAARKVATYLIHLGIQKRPVAVYMPKTGMAIASFFGALYSGNFYTPIDTEMPESRIRKIIDTLQPAAIVTDVVHESEARNFADNVNVLIYESLMAADVDDRMIEATIAKVVDTDICYVLFTSGSTGMPKGVIISQKSVIDYVNWFSDEFDITCKDVLGNQAPLYFDLSIQDIYLPMFSGCTTHLLSHELFVFPTALMHALSEKNVNVIVWAPSALCVVANMKGLSAKILPKLRLVAFCGEVMPVKQLNKWRAVYSSVKFINMYGPTEACDACTYYTIERTFSVSETLPIGKPCHNTDIIILNDKNKLVEDGGIGELCVRGTGVAYGYYNNPEKTKAAFVQNPLNTAYPETIYRTGDLVHYNEYGELMYDGRKDFQIKHMGYRIELGEIETAASAVDGVDRNACVYDSVRDRIHIFYSGEISEDDLKSVLEDAVPMYMIPSDFHKMKALPLNLNGKIDRTKLKSMVME